MCQVLFSSNQGRNLQRTVVGLESEVRDGDLLRASTVDPDGRGAQSLRHSTTLGCGGCGGGSVLQIGGPSGSSRGNLWNISEHVEHLTDLLLEDWLTIFVDGKWQAHKVDADVPRCPISSVQP